VHNRSSTTEKFSPGYTNRDSTLASLADKMSSFFVGPIRAQDFLEFTAGIFDHFNQVFTKSEVKSYDVFVSSDSLSPAAPVLTNPTFPD
jgi:hypothetical protein